MIVIGCRETLMDRVPEIKKSIMVIETNFRNSKKTLEHVTDIMIGSIKDRLQNLNTKIIERKNPNLQEGILNNRNNLIVLTEFHH
ncbi:hypothetical protein QR98_0026760 [Sarcoptes scabiei]|uniref:Uncharacterized protein n=1 Tax=Sarcoptes scabiei TaxID=52283 RepID=A0A131ZZX1_SARSC|nr:hypothetical protein QR98_0026760 [Sarcoptes scabiei]